MSSYDDYDPYGYWEPQKKIVLVPVEVTYHDATDIVYNFKSPTLEEVQKALKDSYK